MITCYKWLKMFWYGFKNEYQNNMCLIEIGLHAENMITILGSIVNIFQGTYMTI